MNFENYVYYDWYPNNNLLRNNREKVQLFNPKEGFERGNMFTNLYQEYKNYRPTSLKANTEKERLLLNLQALCFAAHDLNLYLDLHPEDQSILTLFNDYQRKITEISKEYEQKYGPLLVSNNTNNNSFDWVTEKWPWEGQNV